MRVLRSSQGFCGPFRARRVMAACAALALLTGPVAADVKGKRDDKKKKDPIETISPEVRDIAVTFVAGQSVNIELVASTGTLRPVDFLIRQKPANGTLSEVRLHPRENHKGIVTYTHRGGDAPLTDRFTFAARVNGGPISAPAAVTLTGQRFEPRLEVVDFAPVDRVFQGAEAVIRFVVKNVGAADFAENIAWEEPWRGPPRIELKAGEAGRFAVVFRSDRPGVYRLEKLLQAGVASSKLPLYAQCVRPLTVSPGRLVLTLTSSGSREGELQLSNGRLDPMRVEIRADERLRGGGTFDVPGSGRMKVSLSLSPDDVAAFRGQVQVVTPDGGDVVAVEAAARPSLLKVLSPAGGSLDLGRVAAGREGKGEVVIVNAGGSPSVVQAQVRAPLLVRPAGEAVRIEPGGKATFTVSVTGDQVGELAGELTFAGDSGAPKIPVRWESVPAEPAPVAPMPASGRTAEAGPGSRLPAPGAEPNPAEVARMQQFLLTHLASAGLPVPKERINPFLARVTQVELVDRSAHRLTLAWDKPQVVPAGWIIEMANMVRVEHEGGALIKVWTPLKNWKVIEGPAKKVTARIEPLPAGAQLELRILGVDRDEKVSEPSPAFVITTAEPWSVPAWIWRTLLAALLLVIAYVLNKMRLGEWEWRFWRRAETARN